MGAAVRGPKPRSRTGRRSHRRYRIMITRERRLLKTAMVLALALLVTAPLASFAGVAVGIGIGGPVAPGPGDVWVPGYYSAHGWGPGYLAVPPYGSGLWACAHCGQDRGPPG